jgi:nicotinate-nucleotide pyrophosphorylase
MLDNMSPGDIAKVHEELVRRGLRGRVFLEASGRINEDNVMEYARYVDVVSIAVQDLLTLQNMGVTPIIERQVVD